MPRVEGATPAWGSLRVAGAALTPRWRTECHSMLNGTEGAESNAPAGKGEVRSNRSNDSVWGGGGSPGKIIGPDVDGYGCQT
ncbi:hypothetical protein ACVIHH_007331 [Bradyrhizobium sp. USDA 4518]|nr:hypothetical protein [Bradyrhizobium sp. USDA 4541]MCP1910438.1 hypothetical protein [Bradyrhizobium elkanii]